MVHETGGDPTDGTENKGDPTDGTLNREDDPDFTDGSQSGEINVLRPLDIVVSANDELFVISDEFLVNVYSCQFGQFNQFNQQKRLFPIKPSFAMALLPNGKIVVGGDDHLSVYR